jgi:pimeloyl-ACP methyl ester carboxylesterase
VVVVVVLVAVVIAAAWAFQRRLIYFPDTDAVPSAESAVDGARDVTLRTDDGLNLGAWFVPPPDPARGLTVLVANGNAGNRAGRAPLAEGLAERGFGVLLFDYRGYGGNPGSPSEEGLARDVRAAYNHLVTEEGVELGQMIYFGESLGAAVVTELATEHPPAGIVLRSPFSSLAAVGQEHYPFLPVGLLLRDDFPVVDRIGEVETPVSVVYGQEDSVVPPDQSRAVADAAPELWQRIPVPGADHNDPELTHGEAVIGAVVGLATHLREHER